MKTIAFILSVAMSVSVLAQKNLISVSKSALAGIALPQGSKLDQRILYRATAKTTMDLEAADSNWVLTDNYEVILMPVSNDNDISDTIITSFENNGWTLHVNEKNNKWGVASKGGRKLMIYFQASKKDSWLYMAEIGSGTATKTSATTSNTNARVDEPKPKTTPTAKPTQPAPTGLSKGFQFFTTNFDDGWTAIEKPDWIEVSKGNLMVLLHFANPAVDMSSGQTPVINASAWDVLVAPRYLDKRDYYAFNGNMSYLRSSATSAVLTDKQGQLKYVVLFRRGRGAFIEFIAPDKASFEQEFGMNISQSNSENLIWSNDEQWTKMDNMQTRNKFAVGVQDLAGHWSESSGAYAQMYYTGTGNYAGMNAVSNNAQFWIEADGSYRSQHKGASGMVGSQSFFQEEYKGKYSMNGNWEVSFTNRFKGKTDMYWCQFEIVRGGRILHLTDKTASGMQYHLAKQ